MGFDKALTDMFTLDGPISTHMSRGASGANEHSVQRVI